MKKIILKASSLSLILGLSLTKIAQAVSLNPLERMRSTATNIGLPASTIHPAEVIANIIAILLGLVGIIFFVMIIYSGFQWMTSGGNEEKVTTAKKRLQFAVIGLVVILTSYIITIYVAELINRATCEGYYCLNGGS